MDTRPVVVSPSDLVAARPEEAKAVAYALSSRSDATRRAYAADWAGFVEWCDARGLAALPAFPQTIAAFVADLASTHKPATLSRKLAAISVAHKTAGLASPIGVEPIPSTMAGIRRTHGTAQTKKTPVRIDNLRGAMGEFPDDLRGKRDRALILVGYAGGFRRSELAALDLADVEFVAEGAVLTVRKSKTDQEGKGQRKALHYGKSAATCPVAALKAWIKAAGIAEGALFQPVDRWGKIGAKRIAPEVVANVVKERARLLGLDPDRLGAHSLRAGLVTDGYANGVAEADIMRQTGHRSRAVLEGYYREANLFKRNVTARVGL